MAIDSNTILAAGTGATVATGLLCYVSLYDNLTVVISFWDLGTLGVLLNSFKQ